MIFASINQDGAGNYSLINQGAAARNAYAAIQQNGNANQGTINQFGTTNYAALLQIGDGNMTTITQDGNQGVGAYGYQNGNSNGGSVTQGGGYYANAGFAQIGSNNSMTIRQK